MPMTLIAELSSNHGGDVDLAEEMLYRAAEAGADFVKTQAYSLSALNLKDPQAEWLAQSHLPEEAHVRLIKAAQQAGTRYLSTPFDVDALAMLRRLGLRTFKIASSESTSPWWTPQKGEQWLVSYPWGRRPRVLPDLAITPLTAIPLYPTPPECLAGAMLLDGWSDHTIGLSACEYAIANGARVIEVHFTNGKGRVMPYDKTAVDLLRLKAFAADCETITSGVSTRFRERWSA